MAPIVVIACKVFQSLLEKYIPPDFASEVTFLDYGLHSVPRKLQATLQEALEHLPEPSLVVLGYGLCGNGLKDLRAGPHTLLIPRADDCITILLGSYTAYRREFDAVPGTYYLTKGWLESGSDPLKEYHKLKEKYGEETATWIMDQQYANYKRLAFIAHSESDLEANRPRALEVAKFCERWGFRYEEIVGTDAYIRHLIDAAADPQHAGLDFVVVQPGGVVTQGMFQRGLWENP